MFQIFRRMGGELKWKHSGVEENIQTTVMNELTPDYNM